MVSEPTRLCNTLSLCLTSNDTLVNTVSILPGISDRDIVSATVNLQPVVQKQVHRVMPLYRKADWIGYAKEQCEGLMKDHPSRTVEELWSSFKTVIHNWIAKFVRKTSLGTKKSLPWITQPVKRLIRKRNPLYCKQKSTKSTAVRHHFLKHRPLVTTKIRQSHDRYIEYILGISTLDQKDKNTDSSHTDPSRGSVFMLLT